MRSHNLPDSRPILLLAALALAAAVGRGQEGIGLFAGDPLRVTLIPADQAMATGEMRDHDVNEDGVLDLKEMSEIQWLGDPMRFDVNRNRRLTSLEVAIYFANMRRQFRINAQDVAAARKITNYYDKNGDEKLDKAEGQLLPLPKDFTELDANADGHLSVFEVATQLARISQAGGIEAADQQQGVRYIYVYDKDADMKLNAKEVSDVGWQTDPIQFDTDKDRQLTALEIAAGLAQRRQKEGIEPWDQQQAAKVMKQYDTNHDRRLDAKERAAGGWSRTDVDTDEDGILTVVELATGFAKLRAKQGVQRQDRVAAAKLVSRYDKNRNGSIDLHELLDERTGVDILDTDAFIEFDDDADERLSIVEVAGYVARQRNEQASRRKTAPSSSRQSDAGTGTK